MPNQDFATFADAAAAAQRPQKRRATPVYNNRGSYGGPRLEQACQTPGEWLIEGYGVFRGRRLGKAPAPWHIFKDGIHLQTMPSLDQARVWIAEQLNR